MLQKERVLEKASFLALCPRSPARSMDEKGVRLLDQMLRKTPDEIWSAFDAEIDLWAAGLEAKIYA